MGKVVSRPYLERAYHTPYSLPEKRRRALDLALVGHGGLDADRGASRALEDLADYSVPACHGAMDGAGMAIGIRGFTGEKERVGQRRS